MGKEIFVLAHRGLESLGTNKLLLEGKEIPIYDVEGFIARFGKVAEADTQKDDFFYFCQRTPTFDESIKKYGDRVYEAELEGIITIQNGIVRLI